MTVINTQIFAFYLKVSCSTEELSVLGDLASRVKVVIDSTMPATLHGTSSVVQGVPLAIVNHRWQIHSPIARARTCLLIVFFLQSP